jgi:hypothetical protein
MGVRAFPAFLSWASADCHPANAATMRLPCCTGRLMSHRKARSRASPPAGARPRRNGAGATCPRPIARQREWPSRRPALEDGCKALKCSPRQRGCSSACWCGHCPCRRRWLRPRLSARLTGTAEQRRIRWLSRAPPPTPLPPPLSPPPSPPPRMHRLTAARMPRPAMPVCLGVPRRPTPQPRSTPPAAPVRPAMRLARCHRCHRPHRRLARRRPRGTAARAGAAAGRCTGTGRVGPAQAAQARRPGPSQRLPAAMRRATTHDEPHRASAASRRFLRHRAIVLLAVNAALAGCAGFSPTAASARWRRRPGSVPARTCNGRAPTQTSTPSPSGSPNCWPSR